METGQEQAQPKRRGPWGRRILILVLSLVVALGAAEWWIRSQWPVLGCVLQLDEELLFAPIPGSARVQHMFDTDSVVVRINEQGLFGPLPAEQKTVPRWLVMGDSFVMSENEPYENTFSAQVQKLWGEAAEVLCAAVTGYGPDQNLLRLQQLLPQLDPDGVCLVLCSYNDLGDSIRNHLFYLDESDSLQRRKATVSAFEQEIFKRRLKEAKLPGLQRLWIDSRRWSETKVPEVNATIMADYVRVHREDFAGHMRGETEALGLQKDIYDADVALYPDRESSQYKIRLLGKLVQRMSDLCKERDIPFVCVVVPGGIDLDPENLLAIDTKRYPSYEPDRLCRLISEACTKLEIPTLDLYDAMAAQAASKDLFVGPVDPHWNAQGMRLGAAEFVRFLENAGLTPR